MVWIKLDDRLVDHPKIVGLSDAAFAVWIRGLVYCGRHLTDGVIPRAALRVLGQLDAAGELVDAGLWHERPDGSLEVHDFLEYQPSRAELESKRGAARTRMAKARRVRANNARSSDNPEPVPEPVPVSNPSAEADPERSAKFGRTSREQAAAPITRKGKEELEGMDPRAIAMSKAITQIQAIRKPDAFAERLLGLWDPHHTPELAAQAIRQAAAELPDDVSEERAIRVVRTFFEAAPRRQATANGRRYEKDHEARKRAGGPTLADLADPVARIAASAKLAEGEDRASFERWLRRQNSYGAGDDLKRWRTARARSAAKKATATR